MFRSSALIATIALTVLVARGSTRAEERLVDGIAAQVGSRIVLVSEVLRLVGPQEAALRNAGAPESELAKLRADGLERMIESRLIEEVVRQGELYATDEEINETIKGIAKDNGLSLEQLYASVVFHGMSHEEYRLQIKNDLERRNVVQAVVGQKVTVEEGAIEKFYAERFSEQPQGGDAVHIRQILITYGGPAGRDENSACAEVTQARARIEAGEDFAVVAAEKSEVAPQDGGDIGWVHMDTVASWMSSALAPLEDGGTSDVVLLPFGCCILNLVEKREFTPVSYENARVALHRELYEQELEKNYRAWMEELRERTYIDRRGYFAEAARFGESPFELAKPEGRAIP